MKIAYPTKKLGDVAPFLKGTGLSKKDLLPTGKYKCILYGQLYTTYGPVIDRVVSKTNKSGTVLSKNGDVLIPATTTADEVGIAVASALNEQGVILGGDINVIRTENRELDSGFLAYTLSGPFKMQMARYARGTNIIHLSGKDIAKIEVPIPPLATQKKIVERVNVISKAQKTNHEMMQRVDELFQSLLYTIFSSPSSKWSIKKLGSLASLVRGPFGGSLKKDIFVEVGNCVYEQGNVIDNDLVNFRYFITDKKFEQMERFAVAYGDILMSCSGTIGKLVLVPQNFKKGVINQALLKITPEAGVISEFLKYALESYFTLNTRHIKGGAIKNIASVSELKKINIPLPPLSDQKTVVEKLSVIQRYKKRLIERDRKLDELFNSALSKALAGELVKEDIVTTPAKVSVFPTWQAIGAVLQRFERGEMVVAKILYLAQEIYRVPLGFSFTSQNFGPYDLQIKKAITAGASHRNGFFKQSNGVYGLGANSGKLFKYNSKILNNMKTALDDLMPNIRTSTSAQIECLATVCKVMQDLKSDDLATINDKVQVWKPNKFKKAEIEGALKFIKSKGWDKKLIK